MLMACEAQAWADELAAQNKFEHQEPASARRDKGENIAYKGSSVSHLISYTPETQWYDDEIPAWDFGTSSRQTLNPDLNDPSSDDYISAVGHFTQMVWVATTSIGCAQA